MSKRTTEQFVEEAKKIHGDKYDYSVSEYINNHTKIKIRCPEHGIFEQISTCHINRHQGCPYCSHPSRDTKSFIKTAKQKHGDLYDYSKVDYKNSSTKVCIICQKHGDFLQEPASHISQKAGCPNCKLKGQTLLFEKLTQRFPSENILFEVGSRAIEWLEGQRLDIYFPEYNIAIEYQGKQHYEIVDWFGGQAGFEYSKERDCENERNVLQTHVIYSN